MRYKKIKDQSGQVSNSMILKIVNSIASIVPCNAKNSDYKKYLIWLANNNQPEEAD